MVRHLIHDVARMGAVRDYVAAAKAAIDAAPSAGLPRYTIWTATFGRYNSFWYEADFASIAEHLAAWQRAEAEPAFFERWLELGTYSVEAEDWILEPVG